MKIKTLSIRSIGLVLLAVVVTACASPATEAPVLPTATPTLFIAPQTDFPLTLPAEGVTPLPGTTATVPASTSNLCTDPQVTALIDSFKTAVLNADGALLSSLVSPSNGMEVAFFRNGRAITYSQEQARFLFETTFEVDWGAEPGSGDAKTGSFHDVVVPELVEVFEQPYTLHCNELKYGGASYDVSWPHEGEFYSVYFPGTEANGNLDWHTWAVGIEYVGGKPYIYALTQFFWEP